MSFLNDDGLQYFWLKLKSLLANKVDAENGKGLSTNDFTTEEKIKLSNLVAYTEATTTASGLMSAVDKVKLDGIESGAQINTIDTVKVNGSPLIVSGKAVDISVPVNNSQLVNGAGYQTEAEVKALIAQTSTLKREIVDTLPTTDIDVNTIYMVLKSSGVTGDVYNEYMYINNAWELIGSSDADMTGYVREDDYITNAEIDTIVAS